MADSYGGFNSYEELLAAMASTYDYDDKAETSKPEYGEKAQGAIDAARGVLRKNRRRTALIIAGLVVGTVLTGGALGTAVLGTAGIAAGVGVLAGSAVGLAARWKSVYNTLNPRASRDPEVLHARLLVKGARYDQLLSRLEEQMSATTDKAQFARLQERYKKQLAKQQKFQMKYARSIAAFKIRTDFKTGVRQRSGPMGAVDRLSQSFRDGALVHLGVDRFVNARDKQVKDADKLLASMFASADVAEKRALAHGVDITGQFTGKWEDMLKKDSELNTWFKTLTKPYAEQEIDTTIDMPQTPEERRKSDEYRKVFGKDIEDRFKSHFKDRPFDIDEIKDFVSTEYKDKHAFDNYKNQFINDALQVCGDLDKASAVDFVVDMIKDGSFQKLSKPAKNVVLDFMNKNVDLQQSFMDSTYEAYRTGGKNREEVDLNTRRFISALDRRKKELDERAPEELSEEEPKPDEPKPEDRRRRRSRGRTTGPKPTDPKPTETPKPVDEHARETFGDGWGFGS